MADMKSKVPFGLKIGGGVPIATALVIAVLLLITAIPKKQEMAEDPAAEAEATYQLLLSQLDTGPSTAVIQQPDSSGAQVVGVEASDQARPRNLFLPETKQRFTKSAKPSPKGKSGNRLPRLSGIFIDGASRSAMIAGTIVKAGDLVNGYRVASIDPTSVTLERGGRSHQLMLGARK